MPWDLHLNFCSNDATEKGCVRSVRKLLSIFEWFFDFLFVYILSIYSIHHWRIIWSSYRKLTWVGFEPTITEFRSDALTDWAIRPWLQLALRVYKQDKTQLLYATLSFMRQQSSGIYNVYLSSQWLFFIFTSLTYLIFQTTKQSLT